MAFWTNEAGMMMAKRSSESEKNGKVGLTRIGVGDSRKRSKRNMASLVATLVLDDSLDDAAILRGSGNGKFWTGF